MDAHTIAICENWLYGVEVPRNCVISISIEKESDRANKRDEVNKLSHQFSTIVMMCERATSSLGSRRHHALNSETCFYIFHSGFFFIFSFCCCTFLFRCRIAWKQLTISVHRNNDSLYARRTKYTTLNLSSFFPFHHYTQTHTKKKRKRDRFIKLAHINLFISSHYKANWPDSRWWIITKELNAQRFCIQYKSIFQHSLPNGQLLRFGQPF